MRFLAVIEEQDEGCDYTIECGVAVRVIDAESVEEAKKIALAAFCVWSSNNERNIKKIDLYEIAASHDMSDAFALEVKRLKQEHEDEKRAEKKREIARLQKEIGQ